MKALKKNAVVDKVAGQSFLQEKVTFSWSSASGIKAELLKQLNTESIPDKCLYKDPEDGTLYLIGTVKSEQVAKKDGGRDWWEVEWEHTSIPLVKFKSAASIAPAIFEY